MWILRFLWVMKPDSGTQRVAKWCADSGDQFVVHAHVSSGTTCRRKAVCGYVGQWTTAAAAAAAAASAVTPSGEFVLSAASSRWKVQTGMCKMRLAKKSYTAHGHIEIIILAFPILRFSYIIYRNQCHYRRKKQGTKKQSRRKGEKMRTK
jgi:hypothetical protein